MKLGQLHALRMLPLAIVIVAPLILDPRLGSKLGRHKECVFAQSLTWYFVCVCDRRETLKGCLKTRMKWQNHHWRFQQTSRWGSQACPLRTPEMKLKHVCLIFVVAVSSLGCADGSNQRWYFDGEQIKTPICKKRKRLHWLHLHVWFSVLRCPSFK